MGSPVWRGGPPSKPTALRAARSGIAARIEVTRTCSGRRLARRMEPVDFRDLYERHAGDVRRFAFYLCGERARADDLAAEAFARAWTSVGELRTQTVKAYLFRIVRNLVVEGARRNGREQ